MGVDRGIISQLEHLLRPLRTRISNLVGRGVVKGVSDGKKLQVLQLGVLAGETVDGGEHHQPYGFSSVPLGGAEAVVLFPDGDRARPLVVATSDRRYRPTGGQAGEVCMYTDEGDVVRLGRGHIISLATTGQVRLGSASASDGAIKGTTRNTSEQTFLTAMSTFAAAVSTFAATCTGPTPAQLAALTGAATTFETAIATFKTAAAAAVSGKVKIE